MLYKIEASVHTEITICDIGIKQGIPKSPMLFFIFVNDIIRLKYAYVFVNNFYSTDKILFSKRLLEKDCFAGLFTDPKENQTKR